MVSQGASLRDQQAEFTKRLLLEAARKVISVHSSEEFTMQKVAEEAGVSHRTVYRYFPTRQALIDQFAEFLESEFATKRRIEPDFNHIGDVVRQIYSVFEDHAEYYEAAAQISNGTLRPANQAERTARLRTMFDREFPDLDPDVARKAFAVIRYLIGLQSWYSLRDRFALKDGEAGDAVAWAADELVNALRQGRGPITSQREERSTRDPD